MCRCLQVLIDLIGINVETRHVDVRGYIDEFNVVMIDMNAVGENVRHGNELVTRLVVIEADRGQAHEPDRLRPCRRSRGC